MTCIIAVKTPSGDVLMGCDSCVCSDDKRLMRDPKILIKPNCLMGSAGRIVIQNILKGMKEPQFKKFKDNLDAVIFDFIPRLKAELVKDNLLEVSKNKCIESMDAEIIIAVEGDIIGIYGDFTAMRFQEEYHAIGSGAGIAMGAMYLADAIDKPVYIEEVLYHALNAASKFDIHVSPPFKFITLEEKKFS